MLALIAATLSTAILIRAIVARRPAATVARASARPSLREYRADRRAYR